jgi:hypothetical protein
VPPDRRNSLVNAGGAAHAAWRVKRLSGKNTPFDARPLAVAAGTPLGRMEDADYSVLVISATGEVQMANRFTHALFGYKRGAAPLALCEERKKDLRPSPGVR